MLKTILAISGKPGLYKLISQAKNMLIVEAVENKKRMPIYASDKVISLGDIAMYTNDDEVPLATVLESVKKERRRKGGFFGLQKRLLLKNCMLSWLKFCQNTTVIVFILVILRN